MRADDVKQAIFGAFDGACGALGVVIASVAAGISFAPLVAAVLGGAAANGASMAGGEWLSDSESSLHRAGVMGACTLAGALVPAAPFLLGAAGITGIVFAILAVVVVAVLIAEIRPGARWPSYTKTFGVLLAVLALVIPLSIVLHLAA